MDFIEPELKGFTIYSKSGCINCLKLKKIIAEKHFFLCEINCDEYLIEEKESFLHFIENKSNKSISIFPIVFYEGIFIGGYKEAINCLYKLLVCFD